MPCGGSFAADVTETGWRLFGGCLAIAKNACNAALDKDPSLAAAAAQMLEVQMGQNADRPEMEQYFQLAIAGDPDCYDAYNKKALLPDAQVAWDCRGSAHVRGASAWRVVTQIVTPKQSSNQSLDLRETRRRWEGVEERPFRAA